MAECSGGALGRFAPCMEGLSCNESLWPVYISKDIQHCIFGEGSELAKRAGHSRAGSNGPRRVLVGQIPSLLIAVKPTITVRLLALKWFCLHDFARSGLIWRLDSEHGISGVRTFELCFFSNIRYHEKRHGAVAPESASARPNLHGHLPVLGGVRGLAILMVLLLHFIGNAHTE
jgi:hypothetical protein